VRTDVVTMDDDAKYLCLGIYSVCFIELGNI